MVYQMRVSYPILFIFVNECKHSFVYINLIIEFCIICIEHWGWYSSNKLGSVTTLFSTSYVNFTMYINSSINNLEMQIMTGLEEWTEIQRTKEEFLVLSVNPIHFIYFTNHLPGEFMALLVWSLKLCMVCLSEGQAHILPILVGHVEKVNTQEADNGSTKKETNTKRNRVDVQMGSVRES